MAYPMIIYGLLPIPNWSFETDAPATDPPSGWDDASVGGVNQVVSDQFHSAGSGLPSAQSVRQNVSDGTSGNLARLRARLDVSAIPAFLRGADAPELALAVMLRAANETASANALLEIHQFSGAGATSAPGTGTETTGIVTRRMSYGGPEWRLRVCAVRLAAATTYVDLHLVYDPARRAYDPSADVWWDRCFAGHLLDLGRGFRRITPKVNAGFRVNEGGQAFEIVQLRKPRTEIRVDIHKLFAGTPDYEAMASFDRWLEETPGRLAIWQDRDKHTNAERHWQSCYRDPRYAVKYPAGRTRRNYAMKFVAPAEGH